MWSYVLQMTQGLRACFQCSPPEAATAQAPGTQGNNGCSGVSDLGVAGPVLVGDGIHPGDVKCWASGLHVLARRQRGKTLFRREISALTPKIRFRGTPSTIYADSTISSNSH